MGTVEPPGRVIRTDGEAFQLELREGGTEGRREVDPGLADGLRGRLGLGFVERRHGLLSGR